MNCLVLGGAGFIGSHLVDALVAEGHFVRVFDLPNVTLHNLQQSMDSIEIVHGDFENIAAVLPLLDSIDVVVHLVSTTLPGTSNANPGYDMETNVVGTIRLLEEAAKRGVRKIVFPSSGGTVYGIPQFLPISEDHPTNPICSHGIGKLAIEKYLALFNHMYGLDYTVLRFGNPYGPRQRIRSVQGAIAVFLGHVLQNENITIWGDGSVRRDYFFISDLVSACIRAIKSETSSKVFNIASGESVSLNEILSIIEEITGRVPKVTYHLPRKLDVAVNCLDVTRAQRELHWNPEIPLKEGIARTWGWLTQSLKE
jgi:UDP-glucose 4-epimerase